MKILVTGGAGFIGSHLVDALVGRGEEVLVLDDLSAGKREYLNPKAQFTQVDIRLPAAQEEIRTFKPQVIFHLAAQKSVPASFAHPKHDADINLLGLCNVIEALPGLGLQKFIFSSSGGPMYGLHPELPTSETQLENPSSPYGIAKYASELYLKVLSGHYNFQAIALRPANVYGPRQDASGEGGVIAILTKRAVANQPMRVFGTGKHTRDFVYVADVVDAFLKAIDCNDAGSYNIGTAQETSVLEVIALLEQASGKKLTIDYQPEIAGEMERSALDAGKAKSTLHWQPAVALEVGIRQTYAWFSQKPD